MKKIINAICIALAFISIGLGFIGIILPILPTTPFFLLALLLFAKSSQRFHQWFRKTGIYRKYLDEYVRTRTMPVKTKRKVMITLSLVFLMGLIFTPVLWGKFVILLVWIIHLYLFMFRIQTKKEPELS